MAAYRKLRTLDFLANHGLDILFIDNFDIYFKECSAIVQINLFLKSVSNLKALSIHRKLKIKHSEP